MEKDFEKVKTQIKSKMKAAAALIKEANKIVEASGIKVEDGAEYDEPDENGEYSLALYHYELYDEVQPLMSALTDAGWSASSMRC